MKLFVTGATGFVGSHFVRQALAAGHEVVALRRSSSSKPRVPFSRSPIWLEKPMDRLVATDFAGVEVVVHLAAHTPNVPYDTLENCLYWNLTVPLGFMREAVKAGVVRFTAAGSCFEYGAAAERYERVPPDAPLEPTLSYPTSKAAAAVAFRALASELGLYFRVCRIFQVYGEGEQASRLWPALGRAARNGEDFKMSAGEQIRDFIDVQEVAMQLLDGLDFTEVEPGAIDVCNLGNGRPQSLRDFAVSWWQKWEAKGLLQLGAVPYRPGEIMRLVPEVKARLSSRADSK